MNVGEVLKVLTDDQTTADNIRLAVEQLGDTVLGVEDGEKEIILIIQKAERGSKSTLKMKLSK
jgi:TusA-related sulfurtransferase